MKKLITLYDINMFRDNVIAVKNALRENREIFFKAFDCYKSNIKYAPEIENETYEEHNQIVNWYNAAKNLEEWACVIEGVPEKIKNTYLKKYLR